MDLSKSYSFFQPETIRNRIHIIGCGSVGSTIAENLVRCGVTKLTLWDFDKVEAHNVANQMFRSIDIGKPKVEALRDILIEINPEVEPDLKLCPDGWDGKMLSGYIFIAVDSIELRRKIVETHFDSPYVPAVFDFRTALTSAQHYAADWQDLTQKQNLLKTMQFSHEEAQAAAPVSACGRTLGVATTVRLIVAYGVDNFINFVKTGDLKTVVVADGFNFSLMAFPEDECDE